MPRSMRQAQVSLCPKSVSAMAAILRYRYLGVRHVATICNIKSKVASEMLLRLEQCKLLDHFGNVGIRGYGKTPKMYCLTRLGHTVLSEELSPQGHEVGPFHRPRIRTRWSPLMFHRLDTLDVLACVERDCEGLTQYDLVDTLVEYRREKHGSRWRKETTDFVASGNNPTDKIVPDAGFALRHSASGKCALFLIEVDRGTSRLTTDQDDEDVATYVQKLAQYDRYLASGRIANRHPRLGRFQGFHVLTVTTSARRIENMRAAATAALSPAFHQFFRFSTLEDVRQNALHDRWLSRDHADHATYSRIKGK